MITKTKIASEFKETFKELENVMKQFINDYNVIPFEDSWTAGQIVEHILLSADGFKNMLTAETVDTKRKVDQFKKQLAEILLNFDTKMQSPDFVLPEMKAYEKDTHLNKLREVMETTVDLIETLDLTKTCTSFPLPGLGNLTRYEGIYFVIYHTKRHTNQLNKILFTPN